MYHTNSNYPKIGNINASNTNLTYNTCNNKTEINNFLIQLPEKIDKSRSLSMSSSSNNDTTQEPLNNEQNYFHQSHHHHHHQQQQQQQQQHYHHHHTYLNSQFNSKSCFNDQNKFNHIITNYSYNDFLYNSALNSQNQNSNYFQDTFRLMNNNGNNPQSYYYNQEMSQMNVGSFYCENNNYNETKETCQLKSELDKDDEGRLLKQGMLSGFQYRDTDSCSKHSDDSEIFRNGATIRERNRMHILNDAFDDLRKIVPKTNLNEHQRLSKIATLRLAIHYISALTKILQNSGGCKPVDPSLLPPPQRRRRRRKIAKLQNEPQTSSITDKTDHLKTNCSKVKIKSEPKND